MLRSQAMSEPMRRESFPARYAEARRLILKDDNLDGAIGCLCATRPETQNDSWLWTDLLAAALFARGLYWHCFWVLCAYDGRYPGDPRVRFAIRIVQRRLLCDPLPQP